MIFIFILSEFADVSMLQKKLASINLDDGNKELLVEFFNAQD